MDDQHNKPRGPEDLVDLLKTQDPVFLVGGQAVNLWALHYFERVTDLAPFVSRDIDILGDYSTLEEIARLAKAKAQTFPTRPPTNAIGIVIAHDKNGDPILIEVLKYVHGIKEDELREPSYTFTVGTAKTPICVPGPVALFKAKVANLTDLSQAGRQDTKHVQILARILPDYWKDIGNAVRSEQLTERTFIQYLESVFEVASCPKGKTVLQKLSIPLRSLFLNLEKEALPKVESFIEKRLNRYTES